MADGERLATAPGLCRGPFATENPRDHGIKEMPWLPTFDFEETNRRVIPGLAQRRFLSLRSRRERPLRFHMSLAARDRRHYNASICASRERGSADRRGCGLRLLPSFTERTAYGVRSKLSGTLSTPWHCKELPDARPS